MITINFSPGDIVRVHQKIIDLPAQAVGDPLKDAKERTQVFEGTVLAIKGMDENKTFMVRKVIDGIAVERIWPVNSPLLTKVEVKSKPKKRPRRAKLFYLRNG